MSEMWTVKEAADHMRCHEATIRRMIQRGDLPATRIGRQYRVRPDDLMPKRVAPKPVQPQATGRFARLVREIAGTGGRSDRA